LLHAGAKSLPLMYVDRESDVNYFMIVFMLLMRPRNLFLFDSLACTKFNCPFSLLSAGLSILA
jgi:hypothetical protein